MYLFVVVPVASGLPLPYLSYFSKEEITLGTLVSILVKKRKLPGIVVSVQLVEDARMAIKNAPYTLRKIGSKEKQDFIEESLMKSLLDFGEKTLLPVPTLLSELIPERLISKKDTTKLYSNKKSKKTDTLVLSLPKEERHIRYKSLIRESFAKNESVVLFFPTISELKDATLNLTKGIENYSLVVHSAVKEKEWSEIDEKFLLHHPLLILSTPSLYFLERNDIGLIIIEDESNHHYVNRAGIDFRLFFYHLSTDFSLPLLFGSTLLSLERFNLSSEQKAIPLTPLYLRGGDSFTIIKMEEEKRNNSPYLSYEAIKELEEIKRNGNGHYFIYTQRKGMYPSTVCADCSALLTCKTCDKPLVLHSIANTRAYMCHYCEDLISITEENPIHCNACGGWRMRMLGISSSGIESLLTETGVPVFVIDGERTKTKKEVLRVYESWKKESFAILIGTELALNVLKNCDGATVASLDSLFSLPEYGIDEKIVSLLTTLREKTKGKVFLQTRLSKNPLFTYITEYSFIKYYEWALGERLALHLPPFYTIIKCTFISLREDRKNTITQVLTEEKKEHVWFEAGGQKIMLFIHIKKEEWGENSELRKKILYLCEGGVTEYNPQSFFS